MTGGVQQRFTFYTPKKSQLQNLSTQKNHYFFLAYQKNPLLLFLQPQKIPLFLFATPKNIGIFHRPKKSLLVKISDPKKLLRPPVIKICDWGPLDMTMAVICPIHPILSTLSQDNNKLLLILIDLNILHFQILKFSNFIKIVNFEWLGGT